MGRSKLSPHPSMGLPPGWRVGDLSPSYSSPVAVITAAAANVTSASFEPQANSIQIIAQFSDGRTSCDISLLNDDGTGTFVTVATFTGVTLFKNGMTVGEWPTGISLGGRACKLQIANYAGTGSVTLSYKRLN